MPISLKFVAAIASCLVAASAAQAQVVLSRLDPVSLDTTFASTSGATQALIDFVNLEPFAVDIFWIDYSGNRQFYNTLAANSSYYQPTYLTHPWIAAQTNTGDTLLQGSGTLLSGFLAVTANNSLLTSLADTAIIAPAVVSVPEASSWMLMLAGGAALVLGRRPRKAAVA